MRVACNKSIASKALCETPHASLLDNIAHRKSIDGIVTRYNECPRAIGQNYVLALTYNAETALFQNADSLKMIDARKLWHN